MKTIRYCNDPFEAQVIRGRLENEGIPACVINEHINTVLPYATAMSDMRVQVVVNEVDVERALSLLSEGDGMETALPVCPQCGSVDVAYGFWGSKSLWKKILSVFVLPFAALMGNPVGNLQNHYYCRKCHCEFKRGATQ